MKHGGVAGAWRSAVAPASVLLALALAGFFAREHPWANDAAPQLVGVSEIVPHQVEVGDRVAILGKGFPSGKSARVTFRGTLHRPGERPVRDAEIVILAAVLTGERLEAAFDEATQALFCGAGERAMHTTFEGAVEVAFPAAAVGAAPMAGLLTDVTLDVRPGLAAPTRELEREGSRLLAWMGVQTLARPSGLVVEEVREGSRAQAAGITAGDVVTSFDGVRVASLADLLPPPGERVASIRLQSGEVSGGSSEARERTITVQIEGFRRMPPADRLRAALLIVSMLTIVWLLGSPPPAGIAAALQRVVSGLRERRAASGQDLRRALSTLGREALPRDLPSALTDIGACALIATMPFGQYVIAARLDVGLLFFGAATSLVVASLLGHRSLLRGAVAAGHVAWQHVPSALAVASVVLTTGSLRVQEIEGAQGGWPCDWLAFRSPPAIVALGLLLACTRIEPAGGLASSGLALLLVDHFGPTRDRQKPWIAAARHAHRLIVAGLASVLFLGGWRLPGWSAAEQDASPLLALAGALCLLAKCRLLVLGIVWIRWVLPRWRMGTESRATSFRLVPLALAVLMGTAAWTGWGPAPGEQFLVSLSLIAVIGLAGLAFTHRLRHGLRLGPGADAHLSPFL